MTMLTKFWTYAELEAKVLVDLDMQEEDFVSPEEMLSYANEAIDRAEQHVHTIYEDYLLDYASFSVVPGTDEYALPPTIYAHKIRRILFRDGTTVYTVTRLRDWKKFEHFEHNRVNSTTSGEYQYFLRNSVPGAPTILFSDVPQSGGICRVWFLRQANRLVLSTDILDIPEAHNFVLAYMKYKCIYKETHGEMTAGLQSALAESEKESQLLVDTLVAMVPDADNEIEADYSHYEEMS